MTTSSSQTHTESRNSRPKPISFALRAQRPPTPVHRRNTPKPIKSDDCARALASKKAISVTRDGKGTYPLYLALY